MATVGGTMVATEPIPSPESHGRHCDNTSRSYSSASSSVSGQQSTLASSYSSATASAVHQNLRRGSTKTVLPTIPDDGGFAVPGTTLKAYDKYISNTLRSRFYDLQRLYSTALAEEISKKRRLGLGQFKVKRKNRTANPGPLSMKCKYLGTSEETAKLCIVIHCEKQVSKTVTDFFHQEHVAKDLNGDFEIHIINDGLIRFAAMEDVSVFGNSLGSTSFGRKVHLRLEHASRWATMGGVILVSTAERGDTVFGLLAGHPVADIRDQIERESLASVDDESIEASSLDIMEDEPDSLDSDSSSDSPIAHILSNGKQSTAEDEDNGSIICEEYLGQVIHDSFRNEAEKNYDWCLMELQDSSTMGDDIHLGKFLEWPYPGRARHDTPLFQMSVEAIAITSHGIQAGTLFRDRSSILLLPGSAFVETLRFTLKSGSDLTYGDSGCWVVDSNGHLHGHLVAIDVFQEAYVMPLEETLRSIKSNLQATSIAIPGPNHFNIIIRCQGLRSGDIKEHLRLEKLLLGPFSTQFSIHASPTALFEFPLAEPPTCRIDGMITERRAVESRSNNNAGRHYWVCRFGNTKHFVCWDDAWGLADNNPPCFCFKPSRIGWDILNVFYTCALGNCSFLKLEAGIAEQQNQQSTRVPSERVLVFQDQQRGPSARIIEDLADSLDEDLMIAREALEYQNIANMPSSVEMGSKSSGSKSYSESKGSQSSASIRSSYSGSSYSAPSYSAPSSSKSSYSASSFTPEGFISHSSSRASFTPQSYSRSSYLSQSYSSPSSYTPSSYSASSAAGSRSYGSSSSSAYRSGSSHHDSGPYSSSSLSYRQNTVVNYGQTQFSRGHPTPQYGGYPESNTGSQPQPERKIKLPTVPETEKK
ncbi:hypothetical protein VHEMI06774 [[Torrubiella] hemipterigena]|uniref:Uncharacterized protein n=1 Tax=[Torrubiella] hemipterigena TaxID=1531966 RepID=A0A0A1TK86_9HYPO|nr:hypothetical protein VHEMI06774 [[Torrubiella] hemipterigena]